MGRVPGAPAGPLLLLRSADIYGTCCKSPLNSSSADHIQKCAWKLSSIYWQWGYSRHHEISNFNRIPLYVGQKSLTLFYSVFLVLLLLGGGQICPHPDFSAEFSWIQLKSAELSWTQLNLTNSAEPSWNQLNSAGFSWIQLDSAKFKIQLNIAEFSWI